MCKSNTLNAAEYTTPRFFVQPLEGMQVLSYEEGTSETKGAFANRSCMEAPLRRL